MKRKNDWYIKNANSQILKRYKIFVYSIVVLLILAGLLSIYFGTEIDKRYYAGNLLLIPLAYFYIRIYNRYTTLENSIDLKSKWGKERIADRDFEQISGLFKYLNKQRLKNYLDDQTWKDLNMNRIYAKIDRTLTTPGETVLYDLLRNPLFDKRKLSKRSATIEAFRKDELLRIKTQLALLDLGRDSTKSIYDFIWQDIPKPNKYRYLFYIMSLLALLPLFFIKSMGIKVIIIIFPIFLTNMFIHYYMNKKYAHKIPIITYLCRMIKTALQIENIDIKGIRGYQTRFNEITKCSKKILDKTIFLVPIKSLDVLACVYEYIKIQFLLEVNSFNSSINLINKNINELKEIFLLLGEIDALQSIASYREELDDFTEPFFNNEGYLELVDVRHPLLDNPVSNTIKINQKGILITGSNMAGKSTFLRTIGINVVFAQTIYTCLTSSYNGSLFHILTSISQTDDLTEGKSYYFAESERLFNMIKLSEREYPTLCIVDELLAGTNSLERVNASEEILKYMLKNNALIIVATHDLDLARRLYNNYQCYYFNDNVSEQGLDFDYKIKYGIAVTSNAIKLLEYLGYPKEIVTEAKRKVQNNVSKFSRISND